MASDKSINGIGVATSDVVRVRWTLGTDGGCCCLLLLLLILHWLAAAVGGGSTKFGG